MILLIDNYDSFAHNVARYLTQLGATLNVVRNDALTVDQIRALAPTHIVLSPGPGAPDEAGVMLELIKRCAGEVPMLGICLGHQAIGQAFGGQVVRANRPMHGKPSAIRHSEMGLFRGLPNPCTVGRYHSLIVAPALPDCLEAIAWSEDGEIMGLAHRKYPIFGVQFHPESILTEHGYQILAHFLALPGAVWR
ncbi:MAG: aminodeoxychorismate/anthranilate synthase component II [Pseudomonadota bacterium]